MSTLVEVRYREMPTLQVVPTTRTGIPRGGMTGLGRGSTGDTIRPGLRWSEADPCCDRQIPPSHLMVSDDSGSYPTAEGGGSGDSARSGGQWTVDLAFACGGRPLYRPLVGLTHAPGGTPFGATVHRCPCCCASPALHRARPSDESSRGGVCKELSFIFPPPCFRPLASTSSSYAHDPSRDDILARWLRLGDGGLREAANWLSLGSAQVVEPSLGGFAGFTACSGRVVATCRIQGLWLAGVFFFLFFFFFLLGLRLGWSRYMEHYNYTLLVFSAICIIVIKQSSKS